MASVAPLIFDRALVRRRIARALRDGYEPFLLRRAAVDLADRLAAVKRSFSRVVDLGTPLAALAEARVESGCIEHAIRLAPALSPGGSETGLAVGDEEALPFRPESFDLVVSLLALQSVNDLPGTLVQVRRVLKPDGLFLACLLGGDSLTELRQSFAQAESELEGGASPRVAPFGDVRTLGGLLQRASFALPVVDLERVIVRYASALTLLSDLRAMGFANALLERRRAPLRRSTLLRMASIYAERFADPDGRVRATFDLVWLSGWAPHESQQKPLRPGSARARLADALGVPEYTGEGGTEPGGDPS